MGANVRQAVEGMLRPFEDEGFEVWNVEYVREGRDWQLRVYIDKEGGVGLDDCEYVSRRLSDLLDADDLVGEAYSLVVSSPGLDRPLLKDEHFVRYAGQPVEVSLYRGFEGRKRFAALLGRRTAETLYVTPIDRVLLAPEGDEVAIPAEYVSRVNLMVVI